jgi:hypothetical protein
MLSHVDVSMKTLHAIESTVSVFPKRSREICGQHELGRPLPPGWRLHLRHTRFLTLANYHEQFTVET